jgi:hypothetical protein
MTIASIVDRTDMIEVIDQVDRVTLVTVIRIESVEKAPNQRVSVAEGGSCKRMRNRRIAFVVVA